MTFQGFQGLGALSWSRSRVSRLLRGAVLKEAGM